MMRIIVKTKASAAVDVADAVIGYVVTQVGV